MSDSRKTENCFLSVLDYEAHFLKNADSKALNFICGGCEREETLVENTDAFRRLKLRPRFLRGLSACDLRTTVLGRPVSSPIAIAPMGLNKLAHLDGEIAVARAAESRGMLYTLSVNASTTMENVAKATMTSHKWFQIYILKDRIMTEDLIRRAEESGYTALVITVDNIYKGLRYKAQSDPVVFDTVVKRANYESITRENKMAFGKHYSMYEQSLSWETVDWVRSVTSLPIIIKGIQTGEDAVLATEHGVSGICVSNHGGRQLDSVRPTIEVLPEVVSAVSGNCEVYLDGGVRTGNDILKALALGARAVFIGRPVLYGLFQGGQEGVSRILDIFLNELETVMMLSGCCRVQDISTELVCRTCQCGSTHSG